MRLRSYALLGVTIAALMCGQAYLNAFGRAVPRTIMPVVVYLNPQNNDISADNTESALVSAIAIWNFFAQQTQTTARVVYGGRVTDTAVAIDGRNVMIFRDATSPLSRPEPATTYQWTNTADGELETDTVIWDASFTFFDRSPCTGSTGMFLVNVMAHELGHMLGLSDGGGGMMAPVLSPCSTNHQALTEDDLAALRGYYPVGPNHAPTLAIVSPPNGTVITPGTPLTFSATASDPEEGQIGRRIRWTSSIQGQISPFVDTDAYPTGPELVFTRVLRAGMHQITAEVLDAQNLIASQTITVTVANPTPPAGSTNVALATAGAVATASSFYSSDFSPSVVNDGRRAGPEFWNDATPGSVPDWLQIDFAGTYTIGQVNVFSVQDNFNNPVEPTPDTSFTLYGVRTFSIEYWTGNAWAAIPGASVVGNTLVWKAFGFAPVTTQKIRVNITSINDGYSRLTEVEAFTATSAPPPPPPPPPPTTSTNVAALSTGASITASSFYSTDFSPASVIDGDRSGRAFWNDATGGSLPDSVQIDFAGTYSIGQVNVFSVQDNWANPSEPTPSQTFSSYGVTDFSVEYWTGSAWAPIPGASVAANSLVWRAITFTPVTTSKIRVVITGTTDAYSRLAEVEAWTVGDAPPPPPPPPPPAGTQTNVAALSAGASITASSFYSTDYGPAFIIDGKRAGPAFWNDATAGSFPDSVQIDFAGTYTIGQVNVFSVQDNYANPSEPTSGQTFSYYGVTDFSVEYWTGSAWAPIPGASVAGNSLVWRALTFTPVTTSKIRVVITGTADGYSRLTEVEALTSGS